MITALRRKIRSWRQARRERQADEAQYVEEAKRIRFEHETQKWQGEVSQPKTPKSDW